MKIGNRKGNRLLKIANISSKLGKDLCAHFQLSIVSRETTTQVQFMNREKQNLQGNSEK